MSCCMLAAHDLFQLCIHLKSFLCTHIVLNMGRKSDLSVSKRAQIAVLRDEGLSLRAIASRLNISHSCVTRSLKRINVLGTFKSRQRSGRPRVTTVQDDHVIRRFSTVNPTASANYIASQLPPVLLPLNGAFVLILNYGHIDQQQNLLSPPRTSNIALFFVPATST